MCSLVLKKCSEVKFSQLCKLLFLRLLLGFDAFVIVYCCVVSESGQQKCQSLFCPGKILVVNILKALANEDTLLRAHVAHGVSGAAQTGKHLVRTQNLCPQQMLRVRANGETFVSATMCPRLPGP